METKTLDQRLSFLEGQLAATQQALWAVIAASADSLRLNALAQTRIEDVIAAALTTEMPDEYVEGIEQAKNWLVVRP